MGHNNNEKTSYCNLSNNKFLIFSHKCDIDRYGMCNIT